MSLLIPPVFELVHYRFTIQALESLQLSPFKGSALRGGFGYALKGLACFHQPRCGQQCQLGNECPYGYLFETAPPDDTEVLRSHQDIPRPFIIEPPDDQRTRIPAGERLTFGLTLVGNAINYLPYFILTFRALGEQGLGRTRGKFALIAIDALDPLGSSLPAAVYRLQDDTIRTVDVSVSGEQLNQRAQMLPVDQLTLNFQTPTRLKQRGRWVTDGPPFEIVVRTLLSRLSSLLYFHCGEQLEADFREMIDKAAQVELVQNQTRWSDWSRVSGRQKQRIDMGGLTGEATYRGDLRDYLPLLMVGQYIHLGKGSVFGNGQYQLVS